jgi:peptidoglycan/xylan/chitin deacetylase (PgdA/CDA1 family)
MYSPLSLLRARLRDIARKALARAVLAAVRAGSSKCGVVLLYHEVVRDGDEPVRSLGIWIERSRLDRQVGFVSRRFEVVAASELPDAVAARRRFSRIPLAITFDDDLESHAKLALPVLRDHGVRGTFFVCGASLDEPRTFWWEYLAAAVQRGWSVTDAVGERFSAHLREHDADADPGRAASILQRLDRTSRIELDEHLRGLGIRPAGAPLQAAGIAEIASAGSEIGFHTREHLTLTALTDAELELAVVDGRADVEQLIGASVRSFAYPYGAVDTRVMTAARGARYEVAFAVDGAAVIDSVDRMRVPRIEPQPEPDGRFELRIARALVRRPYR